MFDLFVIGGGSGGVACARRAASHGAKVGLAEDSRLGGTCVIRGCVPKKLMHISSMFRHDFEVAQDMGWSFSEMKHDFRGFLQARNREIARLEQIYHGLLSGAGVRLFENRAHVAGRAGDGFLVEVGGEIYRTRRLVIATGGKPHFPDGIPGIEHAVSSDHVLEDVYDRPERVAVIGAGYIGVEQACIFNGFGCETRLIMRGEEPLRGFDMDVRCSLSEQMRATGLIIMARSEVSRIEPTAGGFRLHGLDEEVVVDLVLYATGRQPKPQTSGIGLGEIDVRLSEKGAIVTDERHCSSIGGLFAIGDCSDHGGRGERAAEYDLTPIAIAEGRAIAERLFNDRDMKVCYDTTPTAVFSTPEASACGLSEEGARQKGYDVQVFKTNFRPMRTSLGNHAYRMFMKLVVDKATDKVLGCHIVGPDAAEMIQGFAVAMTAGATKEQFDDTVAVHPTAAEEIVTMYQPHAG